jgi:hypothetical protein
MNWFDEPIVPFLGFRRRGEARSGRCLLSPVTRRMRNPWGNPHKGW